MKILILDDHALFRAGLRMLLSTIGPGVTTMEAESIAEALALIPAHPDLQLCLVDLALRDEDGFGAIRRIKEAAPHVGVVIVSATEDGAVIRRCIDAGAMSFIPKSVTSDVFTAALSHVLAGTSYLPEQVLASAGDLPSFPALTPRQLQVLHCLSRGLPNKLISRELRLSEHTVREHVSQIFHALGARNRTEAVIRANRLRLVPLAPDPVP